MSAIARFFQGHLNESGLPHRLYEIETGGDLLAFTSRDDAGGAALGRARSILATLV